jgi:hypothetical protein
MDGFPLSLSTGFDLPSSLPRHRQSLQKFSPLIIWLRKALSTEKDCKCQPEGHKSAITEKAIAIFELTKVLFPEKHLGVPM